MFRLVDRLAGSARIYFQMNRSKDGNNRGIVHRRKALVFIPEERASRGTSREKFRDSRRDRILDLPLGATPRHFIPQTDITAGDFTLRECTGFSISAASTLCIPKRLHLSHLRSSRRLVERETHLPESGAALTTRTLACSHPSRSRFPLERYVTHRAGPRDKEPRSNRIFFSHIYLFIR